MFKAIGHCRKSKGSNDNARNSLNSQKLEIIKFASKLDINEDEIKWLIEEDVRSTYSSKADRPILNRAIDDACINTDVKYLFSYSQDRFCRSRVLSQAYEERLKGASVELRFVCSANNIEEIKGESETCIKL